MGGREGNTRIDIIVASYPAVTFLREFLNIELARPIGLNMSQHTGRSSLTRLMPAIVLVTLVTVGLGSGYYLTAAATPPFPVTWSDNPLMIKFSARTATSGSAPDSFTCSPSIAPVTLVTQSSAPNTITLSVSPSAFPSCGSTPNNVVVTASCTASAIASGTCPGEYTGTVTVCGPTPYTCEKKALVVSITVQNTKM